MLKKKLVLSGLIAFAPFLALAAGCDSAPTGGIEALICKIGNILNILIPVMIILAVVYFIWGVIQFVISSSEEAKKNAKSHMIYGIIGLVVIVALWGLVNIVTTTLGTNGTSNQLQSGQIPTVQY